METYESSYTLKNTSPEDFVRICKAMYPDMTEGQIMEKLTNGEGIEINIRNLINKLKSILQTDVSRN